MDTDKHGQGWITNLKKCLTTKYTEYAKGKKLIGHEPAKQHVGRGGHGATIFIL